MRIPIDIPLSAEEQAAWAYIERRIDRFVERMGRVAAPDAGDDADTCACCGNPYLYYDVDAYDVCIVCDWCPSSGGSASDLHPATEGEGKPVTLARARLNATKSGSCFDQAEPKPWEQRFPVERRALVDALAALESDNNPTNDKERWSQIRLTYMALHKLRYPDLGKMVSFVWRFANKVDGKQ